MNILKQLLEKLREDTNYCPYCSGEYAHRSDCILIGLWFNDEIEEKYE